MVLNSIQKCPPPMRALVIECLKTCTNPEMTLAQCIRRARRDIRRTLFRRQSAQPSQTLDPGPRGGLKTPKTRVYNVFLHHIMRTLSPNNAALTSRAIGTLIFRLHCSPDEVAWIMDLPRDTVLLHAASMLESGSNA